MSILALGKQQQKKKKKRKKEKKRKIPNQRVGERKNYRSRIGRKQKKHAERSLDQQYLNNTELSPNKLKKKGERKPRPKVVLSL